MLIRARRLLYLLFLAGLFLLAFPGSSLADHAFEINMAPGKETLTGVIEINTHINKEGVVGDPKLTVQFGKEMDYPKEISLSPMIMDKYDRYQWHTNEYTDGYWTIRQWVHYESDPLKWVEVVHDTRIIDNRWGVPHTEPGMSSGTMTVAGRATGTVDVQVNVKDAYNWTLSKQPAADKGTNKWTNMVSNGLPSDTYHWYTRDEKDGEYTLRLEMQDYRDHRTYVYSSVYVDNRFGEAQTEPGTAQGAMTVPELLKGKVSIPLNFSSGTVSRWRLQHRNAAGRMTLINAGLGNDPFSAQWDTTRSADGAYTLVFEVEDQNRHIRQMTKSVKVQNNADTADPTSDPDPTPAPPPGADPSAQIIRLSLPSETLTDWIGAELDFSSEVADWRLTAQMGRPGDYPQVKAIKTGTKTPIGMITVHFDSGTYADGTWTIRAERKVRLDTGAYAWQTDDFRVVTVDNRPGVPMTQPGTVGGYVGAPGTATGTVEVEIETEPGAVDWVLSKQSAADSAAGRWTKLASGGLAKDSYQWYTRSDGNGIFTLRLEVRDSNRHVQYVTTNVTLENQFGVPQTEPGNAGASLDLPPLVSGGLPIDLNFFGSVTSWKLQHLSPATGRLTSIATNRGGAPQTVEWNTTKVADGTYQVLLEVEDEVRHIFQTTATVTIANKVTTTLKQSISLGEEHRFDLAVAGGLTAFKLGSNPMGYYNLSVHTLDGKLLGAARLNPLADPLQLDLQGGRYFLSVQAQFVLPGAEYTVEMKGATAYTIPLSHISTNLPMAMRGAASLPAIVPTKAAQPASASWQVDDGKETAITNPDGTVDIDSRSLSDGLHTISFKATNAVNFTVFGRYPFVVDNVPSFSDVPDANIARWAVELLKDRAVAKGYADGTFGPDSKVTRAELAKMLAVVAGLDVTKPYSGGFIDVKETDWYAPYVEAVFQAGLVKGSKVAAGMVFKPNDPVSRAELLVMVLRATEVDELLAFAKGKSLTNPDWKGVGDWAKPSLYIGYKMGLMTNREGGLVEAGQPAMRSEVALALARLMLYDQVAPPQPEAAAE